MSITKTLDTLAQEWYGEFGFATCSLQEQDIIVNYVYEQQLNNK
jgi:hypothetical protein